MMRMMIRLRRLLLLLLLLMRVMLRLRRLLLLLLLVVERCARDGERQHDSFADLLLRFFDHVRASIRRSRRDRHRQRHLRTILAHLLMQRRCTLIVRVTRAHQRVRRRIRHDERVMEVCVLAEFDSRAHECHHTMDWSRRDEDCRSRRTERGEIDRRAGGMQARG
jgi:hypothetical protein